MLTLDQYEIGAATDGDLASLLELYRALRPGALVGDGREHWTWKFGAASSGRRVLVARANGAVVGQFAAIPRKAWILGGEQTYANVVDSMVLPEHRGGLRRPALFARLGDAFAREFGGAPGDLCHYAFPAVEPQRLGDSGLKYELVRTLTALVAVPEARALDPELRVLESYDEQIRWLFDRCAGEWGASTIRDADYFRWRFERAPGREYVPLGIYREGILRGLAVTARGDWFRPGGGLLVEWLVPSAEPEIGAALRDAVLTRAREQGLGEVATSIPEWSPWFESFQAAGWRVHPTSTVLWSRSFHRQTRPETLRTHWWLQLSDSDLV